MRWIVDAMNVIGSRPDGWWRDRRLAMDRLVEQLEQWSAAEGHDVTVVFERPTLHHSPVIIIASAPEAAANSADDEILRQVRADAQPTAITVVTSDITLADRVRQLGASVYPARKFRDKIDGGRAGPEVE